jgi:hypothetical protein
MRVCKLMLMVLLAANVARAQTPSTEAPAKTEAATPAPEAAASAPKADAPSRPYIDSAITFLKALSHTNRSGPDGEQAWNELRSVSIDQVPLKVAGKEMTIDAKGGHSSAMLLRFSKVATWREAFDVQGVTVEKAQLKIGEEEHTGKARIKLAEKDGKWIVQSLEVE